MTRQVTSRDGGPTVFMFDLLATVPYYTAYLSQALLKQGTRLRVGSITYYLDVACFSSRGIALHPGLLDVVGKLKLSRRPRRVLKLLESLINLAALSVRFLFAYPAILHVQYLPLLRWPVPFDLWFVRFCRWRGAKIVLTVHDLLPHDSGERFRETFQKLYLNVDEIICHSGHVQARLQTEFSVPAASIAVIPHGPFFYDLPLRPPPPSLGLEVGAAETVVLWQGIIFPYKGVDLLLEAWQNVEAHSPGALLVVAGTGSPELLQQIEAQVERLKLKRVKLLFRFVSPEELVALYRAADVVVYPYRAITTSGALATGLALGRTIVASDLPVFRELLTDGKNALLIDPANATQFAEALSKLLGDPVLRTRLADNVRSMNFGDHSWSLIASETDRIYQDLAGRSERVMLSGRS